MSLTQHRFTVSITTADPPGEVTAAVRQAVDDLANRLGLSGNDVFAIMVGDADGNIVTEYAYDPTELAAS